MFLVEMGPAIVSSEGSISLESGEHIVSPALSAVATSLPSSVVLPSRSLSCFWVTRYLSALADSPGRSSVYELSKTSRRIAATVSPSAGFIGVAPWPRRTLDRVLCQKIRPELRILFSSPSFLLYPLIRWTPRKIQSFLGPTLSSS